ncbi:aminopeptidase N [Pseudoalteromonas luteoviolacea]|uniref:aminopeptidase N n=1 Tax=Pseudoalteromonas luteoviolacea TaxID=43657 RepID=UPI001B36641F|nr:aminopeptidase N [Pseudoalteromonas luteoviolacea]MBQ4812606.1 aminopeptidase N [Pseudoalteromonas luteoviolacea]
MTQKPQAKFLKDYQPPSHQVDHIDLNFDLSPKKTVVTAKYQLTANDHQTSVELDGVDLKLISLKVNGQAHNEYEVTDTKLIIANLPSKFELEVGTEIAPELNTSLEGLYLSDGAYCTQCEAEGFRKITYFFDRPDVLATYAVTVIGDSSFPYLLSNGNKVDEGTLENGKHFVKWEDPFKKPSYLFALVAGEFDLLVDSFKTKSGRDVKLQIFVDKGNLSKAPHAMESLKKSMKWDEERFDLEYDLDIYMIVAVDFFNMGAMENKGLNVFNSACVLANQETATDRDYHVIESIVGHEYFHNWTGNRVTCRDWFQLSLKEGLTVFRDQEFSSDLGSRALNRIDAVNAMRTHQFAEDAGPMAHPIRPEKVIEMNNFYTVTVYNKGAEVIRMMHTLLGESGFQQGMKLYFERHDGQAVTCDDFVNSMADATGTDLSQFKLWYSQFGTPKLKVRTQYNENQCQYQVEIEQVHAEQDPIQSPLHIPVAIELLDGEGGKIDIEHPEVRQGRVIELKEEIQTFTFSDISEEPTLVLLEDFSAPCILEYDYSTTQLCHIAMFATSDYARWEALQQLYTQQIREYVADQKHEFVLSQELSAVLLSLFDNKPKDLAILAEYITIPNFDTLSAGYAQVPVEALCKAIDELESQIAQLLQGVLKAFYNETQESGSLSATDVAVRALKNRSLYYLSLTGEDVMASLNAQASSANMTNKLGALRSAVNAEHRLADELMDNFDKQWNHDLLVMDKWFALQATKKADACIDNILSLYEHPCFDKSNPNRVRALVGTFARTNPKQFHREDGAGYKLLADLICELNQLNPQNASRIITPLLSFKRFDEKRQGLMKAQLERLSSIENLSDDLFEKIDKALN